MVERETDSGNDMSGRKEKDTSATDFETIYITRMSVQANLGAFLLRDLDFSGLVWNHCCVMTTRT